MPALVWCSFSSRLQCKQAASQHSSSASYQSACLGWGEGRNRARGGGTWQWLPSLDLISGGGSGSCSIHQNTQRGAEKPHCGWQGFPGGRGQLPPFSQRDTSSCLAAVGCSLLATAVPVAVRQFRIGLLVMGEEEVLLKLCSTHFST